MTGTRDTRWSGKLQTGIRFPKAILRRFLHLKSYIYILNIVSQVTLFSFQSCFTVWLILQNSLKFPASLKGHAHKPFEVSTCIFSSYDFLKSTLLCK